MRAIPTIFLRELDSDSRAPGRVLNVWRRDCDWVRNGEGVARRKLDGLCCLIQDGHFYKRHVVHLGEQQPPDFVAVEETFVHSIVGWRPVTASPNDKWHREAITKGLPPNGTYELVGPRIHEGKDGYTHHTLVAHDATTELDSAPRTFDELRGYLSFVQIEGIVWHRGNGEMAKIKRRDFGIMW